MPEALFMVFQLDSKGVSHGFQKALFMVFLSESKGAKVVFRLESQFAKVCKSCRSRQELSNEYLIVKFDFDTAENEPLKVCQKIANSYDKS